MGIGCEPDRLGLSILEWAHSGPGALLRWHLAGPGLTCVATWLSPAGWRPGALGWFHACISVPPLFSALDLKCMFGVFTKPCLGKPEMEEGGVLSTTGEDLRRAAAHTMPRPDLTADKALTAAVLRAMDAHTAIIMDIAQRTAVPPSDEEEDLLMEIKSVRRPWLHAQAESPRRIARDNEPQPSLWRMARDIKVGKVCKAVRPHVPR